MVVETNGKVIHAKEDEITSSYPGFEHLQESIVCGAAGSSIFGINEDILSPYYHVDPSI